MSGAKAVRVLTDLGVRLPETQSSNPKKVLNWIIRSNNYQWSAKYHGSIKGVDKSLTESVVFFEEEDDEIAFPEGKELYRLHKTRERNPRVIELAKKRAVERDNMLRCEACGFSFRETYGAKGEGFIEAHHNVPLSELSLPTETRVEDIALVCSNCHRMLHRKRPWLTITELKTLIEANLIGKS